MDIIEYTDLLSENLKYNYLKSKDSFPIEEVTGEKIVELKKIKVIEYIFEGMVNERSQNMYTDLKSKFEEGIFEILKLDHRGIFIYSIENSSNSISRLRSYKGYINKKEINSNDFVEKEIIIKDNESRIAFVAKLNDNNFKYLFNYFYDYSNSFIISSNKNYLNVDFIDEVASLFKLEGWTHINFLNIVLNFCHKNDFLYRIGGDDGEECWSLQKFTNK